MKQDVPITDTITIPEHELVITASRAGGPGGQHVNKTSTRITVHWNVYKSQAVTEEQKQRIAQKLQARITHEGDIVVHNSSSRSQQHNKKMALAHLAQLLRKALHVPKKRIPTAASKMAHEVRLRSKAQHGALKKKRRETFEED